METVEPMTRDNNYKELKKLISTLTHTGEKQLDPPVLKGITKICKISNDYIIHAYNLLMGHLEANHAEVRFSCFQICMELFKRSHCFRELLVANLDQVMLLTIETNPMKPLPKPRSTALALKKMALTTIRDWAKQYGTGYKKLLLGISFLRNCKRVDLNAMAQEEAAERSRGEELQRRKKAIQKERFKKVADELREKQPDIVNALTEMESCLSLMLPTPEDFFIEGDSTCQLHEDQNPKDQNVSDSQSSMEPELMESSSCQKGTMNKDGHDSSTDDEDGDGENGETFTSKNPIFDFRKYGIINPHFSITLRVDPGTEPLVKKTEENAAIFESAEELFKVVTNRYHPYILKWETILEKCSDLDDSTVGETAQRIKDLKSRLEILVDKYKRLNLERFNKAVDDLKDDDSETSDSDFEEVENKAGFEAFSKSAPVMPSDKDISEAGPSSSKQSKRKYRTPKDWSLVSEENHEKDPTSLLSTLSSMATQKPVSTSSSSTNASTITTTINVDSEDVSNLKKLDSPQKHNLDDRKSKLLSVAPKLPFDVDLYHWEDEKVEAPTRLTVKPDGHRFWVSTAEDRDEIRDPDGEASIRTRVIEFTGNFEKVKWTCRAPLPSGKLCPRQDRVKCPFHGKIIARDERGKPSKPEDQQAEADRLEAEKANEVPEWQDPKLLAELKESTGVDLRMPDKTKRGWRKHLPGEEKKYVGLTDLKATQNTTYNRLSRKVFKKSSMRRVAADLDKLERRKFRDKYGDQFNYMFDH